MATFRYAKGPDGIRRNHQFTFINHSNKPIGYDLEPATGEEIKGSVEPGKTIDTRYIEVGSSIEQGNVNIVTSLGTPTNPGFRFWSGGSDQYINVLGGDGWKVTKDTDEISEVTGNGFRVTVDGGGVNDPTVSDIYIQVYNA